MDSPPSSRGSQIAHCRSILSSSSVTFQDPAETNNERKNFSNKAACDGFLSTEQYRLKVLEWMNKVENRAGVCPRPTIPYKHISTLFAEIFHDQMSPPGAPRRHLRRVGEGGRNEYVILQNGQHLEPDISFSLREPRSPGDTTQPDGLDYPCIVFDTAERIEELLKKCELWLSDQTSVNVWIGVSYQRNYIPGEGPRDEWWMGVARRDFDAMEEGIPINWPENTLWPSPVWMYSLPHGGRLNAPPYYAGRLDLVTTAQHGNWRIPMNFLIHPLEEIPPELERPGPPQKALILSPEAFRTHIVAGLL